MNVLRYCLLLLAVVSVSFVGCKKGPAKAKWTILAYYDGNCDLDISRNGNSWVVAEAQEAEEVGSTDDVQMIAMVGSVRLGGQCKYYRIEKHENEMPDSLKSTVLEELGTKAMSNPTVLTDFIKYAIDKYPAEHYMLMIKNHGGGWKGACLDQQNGGGAMMTMPQIRQALQAVGDTFRFDVITFDACLMGMCEVAYELRDRADYLVASQFVTYAGTYGSAEWLGYLTANDTASGLTLAKKVVTSCMNANIAHGFTGQQAVIDLSQMQALASKVATFGIELVTASGSYSGEILDAFVHTNSTELDDRANCDLLEFCNLVRQEQGLKTIPQIMTATTDVINALSAAVPMTMTNAVGLSRGGLCIYIPYQAQMFDSANYVQCEWRSTNWHSFISQLIAALGGGGGGEGWISLNSNPTGATIWVNGTNTGSQTPALMSGAPNTYQIKLTLSGYVDWQQDVTIRAGETTAVNATLQPQGGGEGWISINSTPQGATIWVNGTNTGSQTPALMSGAPATYQIKLTLTGYQDWQQNVSINANETTYVNATLQPQGGGQLNVSGTVTWPGHSLSNYCIAFLDTSHTSTIYPIGIVQVNPGNGAYTIQLDLGGPLEAYVEAFDDVDNNGNIDPGEGLGWWDQNGNNEWDDMLTFQPGQTVTNANIVLQTQDKDKPFKYRFGK